MNATSQAAVRQTIAALTTERDEIEATIASLSELLDETPPPWKKAASKPREKAEPPDRHWRVKKGDRYVCSRCDETHSTKADFSDQCTGKP